MRECMLQVEHLLKAMRPCIWIDTYEEYEVIKDLKEILSVKIIGYNLYLWSHTEGLTKLPLTMHELREPPNRQLMHPRALFEHIKNIQDDPSKENINSLKNIFVLRDFHLLSETPECKRALRDLKEYPNKNYNPIIVTSPVVNIPVEHEKLFAVVNYGVPSKLDIERIVVAMSNKMENANNEKGKNYTIATRDEQRELVNACVGLTVNEISAVFAKSLVKYNNLSLTSIMDEKIQLVQKSGVLDYVVPQFTINDIGGNDAFKDWLLETKEAFEDGAQDFGVPKPKGCICIGVPGSSKTASAEAFANLMKYPLLKLSMDRIMSRFVGDSERKIAQACKVAKACAPCVLLIDEAEKALGGAKSSNQSDSGTTNRVLAQILEFLNEDTGVYVIMTSNDVSQLPPELTRSGRLDAQWYFGLPFFEERKEIFKIHFAKTGKTVNDDLITSAAQNTENYTGAEIKDIVKVAMRKAYKRFKQDNNHELTKPDVLSAITEVVPIYKSSQEKILALETYAKGRARNTSVANKNDSIPIDDNLLGILQFGGI